MLYNASRFLQSTGSALSEKKSFFTTWGHAIIPYICILPLPSDFKTQLSLSVSLNSEMESSILFCVNVWAENESHSPT